jgi:hypothetical protein
VLRQKCKVKSEWLTFLAVQDYLQRHLRNMKKTPQMQLLQQVMLSLRQQGMLEMEIQQMVDGKMQIRILHAITLL